LLRPLQADLEAIQSVTLIEYSQRVHLERIHRLFNHLWTIKDTPANWVATSKTLYLLLPDLIVPMDNRFTKPFLHGWWPTRTDRDFLADVYWIFALIARVAGEPTLRQIAKLDSLDRAPGENLPPLGMARVVDAGIVGFQKLRQAG
jgi:hypothetical protein